MRLQVQGFRAPGWIVPVLVLVALALLPFALMLALGLGVLALGAGALQVLLGGGERPRPKNDNIRPGLRDPEGTRTKVIDVDYEVVKEDHEKE